MKYNNCSQLRLRLSVFALAGLSAAALSEGLWLPSAFAQPQRVAPEVAQFDDFLQPNRIDPTQAIQAPFEVWNPDVLTPIEPNLLEPELPLDVNQPVEPEAPPVTNDYTLVREDLQRFLINFNDAYLVYEPGVPGIQIAAQNNVLSYGWDWEVVELKPYLYAFRQANWDGFYWQVNTSRKEVYRVTNGSFGELGGDKEQLEMSVDTVGSPEATERFMLRFVDAYLVRANDGVLQVATEGNVLSYGGDWEVAELQPYLFQLRQSVWKGFYWQVNTSREIVQRINDDNFGELSDRDRDDLDVQVEAVY